MTERTGDETVTHWIRNVKSRDEEALRKIWERYFDKVTRVARHRLGPSRGGDADEEDIALDVFESFYVGMAKGQFPRLENRDDLWQILVVLTARRAINARQHRRAAKRGGGAVRGDSIAPSTSDSSRVGGLDRLASDAREPGFIAQVMEECEYLIEILETDELRRIARWRLEGYSTEEIAGPDRLDCSVRSVERKLNRIRQRWRESRDLDLPI